MHTFMIERILLELFEFMLSKQLALSNCQAVTAARTGPFKICNCPLEQRPTLTKHL